MRRVAASPSVAIAAAALLGGCGARSNPYEATIEGVLLADADQVIPAPAAASAPLVKVTVAAPDPTPAAGPVRLAIERKVPWGRVHALLGRYAAAGGEPALLVGKRDVVHAWVLSDEITGPAIQVTSTPDGKFCVGPPTVELAKCVQSSDKLHINRAFVREILRDAVKEYELTEVEVHAVSGLEWADVVRTVDGVRTCCGKTVIKARLAAPDEPVKVPEAPEDEAAAPDDATGDDAGAGDGAGAGDDAE